MHQEVFEAFHRFNVPLEAEVRWMYLDIKGLVTTAVGNLIDPVGLALSLPWSLPDGQPAPRDVIAEQWAVVKEHQELAHRHYNAAAAFSTVRLNDDAIAEVVRERLLANEAVLKQYFARWNEFPADAQLGCLSMAWAVGAGFPRIFSNFARAANAGDWSGARAACEIRSDNNPGVVPRNANNRLCLGNAAAVVAQGLPRETLFWPSVVPAGPHTDEDSSPTWVALRARVYDDQFPLPVGGTADIDRIEGT